MFGDMYSGFKFDDYPNNGSKVTAVFLNLNFGWDFRTLGVFGGVFRVYHPPNFGLK